MTSSPPPPFSEVFFESATILSATTSTMTRGAEGGVSATTNVVSEGRDAWILMRAGTTGYVFENVPPRRDSKRIVRW